jgi:formylglycine-generating enzyme required for sulfatase activity
MRKLRRWEIQTAILGLALLMGAVAAGIRFPIPDMADVQAQLREAARTPEGMVYVPGGAYLEGSNEADADEDVRPQRRVFVPAFYIDRTEVTNAEFKRVHRTPFHRERQSCR